MDEGGFEPPSANTVALKATPLDLTRALILINTMSFNDIFDTRCGARTHGHTLKRRALYRLS